MKRILIVSFGFFALAAVVGGVFWLGKKDKAMKEPYGEQNNMQQQNVDNLDNSVEKDIDISNWNIYKNEKYGYVVRYPEGWVLKNENLREVSLNSEENEGNLEKIKTGAMYGEGYMEDVIISYYESVANEPENIENHLGAKSLDDLVNTNVLISRIEKVKFSGEDAWLVKRGGFGAYLTVLTVHNGHLYQIMFGNREERENLTETDKGILDSFSFIR